ncbi:MAG: GHKL domain-containing protein [Lachnospiraceae bacterium]|jgi:signal transduction histidine kinase|nr:GHKL domain-containing protein [Lachnospiraceae bacterium]
MLVLLLGVFMIASGFVLYRKRSMESFFLSGMCISLMLEFCGILIFAAKKGGYSREMLEFLFVSMELKTTIQYLVIPLNVIGYMIALGRYLFPLFLLQIAMRYSMISAIRKDPLIKKLSVLLPVVSLIVYYPGIYKTVTLNRPKLQEFLTEFSYFWILLYICIALILLIHEYFSITMVFFRRQFSLIVICMIAISGLYLLYCGQDPGQVYRFYHASYKWKRGIGYLQHMWDIKAYYLLMLINVVCGILGFISLMRYTQENYANDMEEVVMERKYNTARVGTLVFVHSTKNQLLANRVIFKRLNGLDMDKEADVKKAKEYIATLEDINESLLERMEELYRSVKSSSIYMISCRLEEIVANALERFHDKCPGVPVEVVLESDVSVLADKAHLCEAIYNLLINAQDAVEAAELGEKGKVSLLSHDERLYTVIEIKDNGVGIPKATMKKIFEPFYTSKNRNHNWGMGLYYVRAIVKGHLGSLRVESKEGKGSSFYILLPKYMSA